MLKRGADRLTEVRPGMAYSPILRACTSMQGRSCSTTSSAGKRLLRVVRHSLP